MLASHCPGAQHAGEVQASPIPRVSNYVSKVGHLQDVCSFKKLFGHQSVVSRIGKVRWGMVWVGLAYVSKFLNTKTSTPKCRTPKK
jgi:hypothetical protein